jgi:hypothetical protein
MFMAASIPAGRRGFAITGFIVLFPRNFSILILHDETGCPAGDSSRKITARGSPSQITPRRFYGKLKIFYTAWDVMAGTGRHT